MEKAPSNAVMSLPHPQRLRQYDSLRIDAEMMQRYAPLAWAKAKDPHCNRYEIANTYINKHPAIANLFSSGGDREQLLDIALRAMVAADRVRMFQTTDPLETMLRETDFGDEVPASWFRLPFPNIYIEFGSHRDSPLRLHHDQSGDHVVEGCYLLESQEDGSRFSEGCTRAIDMVAFGSPFGKSEIMDDVYVHTPIKIFDENTPISEIVRQSLSHFRELGYGTRNDDAIIPIVEHVAKILVYLNTADARRQSVTEGTDAMKRIAGMKSPAKIEKAKRKAAIFYDRIVVGPATLPTSSSSSGRGDMKVHWRRGHMRSQPYGPSSTLRRPVWIQPILVRADRLNDDEISHPNYQIGRE